MQENRDDTLITTVVVLILLLVVAVPIVMILAMAGFGGTWSDSNWGMMSFPGGGWLFMAVPVVVVIIVLMVLATSGSRSGTSQLPPYVPAAQAYPVQSAGGSDAYAILDRRLASGEISLDEYVRVKAELGKR